jgi:hypothetical protein
MKSLSPFQNLFWMLKDRFPHLYYTAICMESLQPFLSKKVLFEGLLKLYVKEKLKKIFYVFKFLH